MILYAPAKINVGLQILSKRKDGFHDLSTLMVPVPFYDLIELQVERSSSDEVEYISSGLEIDGENETNLCVRAARLFRQASGMKGMIRIHLHKQIPLGAGLGGGSSDASSILIGCNKLFKNPFSTEELTKLAEQLGSDCPLFIHEKPMIAKGRGEILTESTITLSGHFIAILYPEITISTAEAYNMIVPVADQPPLEQLLSHPISEWKESVSNDFESTIFPLYPSIKHLKNRLYDQGAIYASMSGSGSSVYGIFEKKPELSTDIKQFLIWIGQV